MALPGRLRVLRAEYPAFVALSAVTVAVLLVWPVADFYLRQMEITTQFWFADFRVYSGAVDRWAAGDPLYVRDESGGYFLSYLYPPVTVLLFYPFATFEFPTGAILFSAASLVLLWVGLEAVASVLGYDLRPWERLALLVALFGFQPAARDFKWAQVSTLLTALLCFAFYAQELGERGGPRRRLYRYASGALTTVGSSFKIYFATSGAHLLRDRSRFVGATVTAGALLAVSVAVMGVDAHRSYLDVLRWGKGWGDARPPSVWDTSAAYKPLYVLGELATPVRVLGLLGVVGLTLATRDVETAPARRATFALGVAAVPLFAPRADTHDLVVALLPAVVLLALELDRPRGYPSLPVLSVLLFHLHRYVVEVAVNPPAWLPVARLVREHAAWFQPGMYATVLLVGLAAYRVAEHVPVWSLSGVTRRRST